MCVSPEPGYYQDNEWGIRLETILTVVPRESKVSGGSLLMMSDIVYLCVLLISLS